jgi:hypothetical protein
MIIATLSAAGAQKMKGRIAASTAPLSISSLSQSYLPASLHLSRIDLVVREFKPARI